MFQAMISYGVHPVRRPRDRENKGVCREDLGELTHPLRFRANRSGRPKNSRLVAFSRTATVVRISVKKNGKIVQHPTGTLDPMQDGGGDGGGEGATFCVAVPTMLDGRRVATRGGRRLEAARVPAMWDGRRVAVTACVGTPTIAGSEWAGGESKRH